MPLCMKSSHIKHKSLALSSTWATPLHSPILAGSLNLQTPAVTIWWLINRAFWLPWLIYSFSFLVRNHTGTHSIHAMNMASIWQIALV